MKLFRPATAIAAACFAIFLIIDFVGLDYWQLSRACKYVGLLCCVCCAFTRKEPLLIATLCLTAVCDFLLLFTDLYLPGVLLFIIVQGLYTVRGLRLNELRTALAAAFAAAAAVAGIAGTIAACDALFAASAAYAVLLFSAAGLACAAFLRKRGDAARTGFAALGMALFVACDVCVALFNLGSMAAVNWIWLFYLPSQWFLAASGIGGNDARSDAEILRVE